MTDREGELRALLDRVEDERDRVRARRRRRVARLVGGVLAAAVPLIVIAALVDAAAIVGHPWWSGIGLGVVLLVGHGLSAEVHGLLRAREEDVLGLRPVIRAHRDHELAGWPGTPGEDGRQWLLDDLDDARADRRRVVRQLTGAAVAAALLAGAVVGEQARLGALWPAEWGVRLLVLGTICGAVPAFEVLVSVVAGGRLAAAKANLLAARRRHRDTALYDEPPPNPRPAVELPPVAQSGWAFAVLPVVAVVCLAGLGLWVMVPAAEAPAPAASPVPDLATTPTKLAGRKSAVPLDWPAGVAVAPDGRHAYVANAGPADKPDATVAVVDLGADTVTATLPVAAHPMALALTRDGRRLVVASTGPDKAPAGALTVLDPVARQVVSTVPLASTPLDVAVSADGRTAWCVISGAGQYDVGAAVAIDITKGTVVASVPVGVNPAAIALDGGRAYVANFGENTVSVVDTGTRSVVSTVDAGAGPAGLVVDQRRHTVWVADQSESDAHRALTAIDTGTLEATPVDIGPPPAGAGGGGTLALTPDGRRLLVGRSSAKMDPLPLLDVVDPATRRTVGVITMPYAYRVAAAPDSHHAITSSGDLWILDIP